MKASNKKKLFLEKIIAMSSDSSTVTEVQKKQYDFFIKNTNGGKMYKYRSFDKHGYALKNLRDSTIHCSMANTFNDPFDSKLGIDLKSLIRAKYRKEIDIIASVFEKYINYVHGALNLNDCTIDEQRIIQALSKNKKIAQFVSDSITAFESNKKAVEYLSSNISIALELLKVILEDSVLNKSLGFVQGVFPNLTAYITPETINCSGENSINLQKMAKKNGVDIDADEIELLMLLSSTFDKERKDTIRRLEAMLDTIQNQSNDLFWIGCLATDPKNCLMWSHYSNGHKGFCIEYDLAGLKDSIIPLPIMYSKTRPLFPWEPAFDSSPEVFEAAVRAITLGLLTKDNSWKYEDEWRILLPAANNPADIVLPITAVYLGANIEESNKEAILQIAKDNEITVYQMKTDRSTYDLHTTPINL